MARNVNWNRGFSGIRQDIWQQQRDLAKQKSELEYMKWKRARNWKIAAGAIAAAVPLGLIAGGAALGLSGKGAALKGLKGFGAKLGAKLGTEATTGAGKIIRGALGVNKGGVGIHGKGLTSVIKAAGDKGSGLKALGKSLMNRYGISDVSEIFSKKGLRAALNVVDLAKSKSPEAVLQKLIQFDKTQGFNAATKNILNTANKGVDVAISNALNGSYKLPANSTQKIDGVNIVNPNGNNNTNIFSNFDTSLQPALLNIKENLSNPLNESEALNDSNNAIKQMGEIRQIRGILGNYGNIFRQYEQDPSLMSKAIDTDTATTLRFLGTGQFGYGGTDGDGNHLINILDPDGNVLESRNFSDIQSQLQNVVNKVDVDNIENTISGLQSKLLKQGYTDLDDNAERIIRQDIRPLLSNKNSRISLGVDYFGDTIENEDDLSIIAPDLFPEGIPENIQQNWGEATALERARMMEDSGVLQKYLEGEMIDRVAWGEVHEDNESIFSDYLSPKDYRTYITNSPENIQARTIAAQNLYKENSYKLLTEFAEGKRGVDFLGVLTRPDGKFGIKSIVKKKVPVEAADGTVQQVLRPVVTMHNGNVFNLTNDVTTDLSLLAENIGLNKNQIKELVDLIPNNEESEKSNNNQSESKGWLSRAWDSLFGEDDEEEAEEVDEFDYSGLDN